MTDMPPPLRPPRAAPPSFGPAATRKTCRGCGGSRLDTVFADLGTQPPANSYLRDPDEAARECSFPLRAVVCADCFLVQVDTDVPREQLFLDYAYFSSFSESWLRHAKAYSEMAIERFELKSSSFVIEVASNDGYLLQNFVAAGIPCLGIEPSSTVALAAKRKGVPTEIVFLDSNTAGSLVAKYRRADLLIANNVWAHVPDLNSFTAGIARLLRPEGTLTIEVQHLLPLMQHIEFDTIYHEHYSYFSLLAAERLLARHGLKVFEVEQLPTHGGSLRYYIVPSSRTDIREQKGVIAMRAAEKVAGLGELATYKAFAGHIAPCRDGLRRFLAEAKTRQKKVAAYGAAAKGNTFLNYCGIGRDDIAMVADRNTYKQGRLLPGSHLPILPPSSLLELKPDYVLILAWNLKDEIMQQLSDLRRSGTQFVTAVPTLRIWN
jgi:SAM-dependent methyltransferase